MQASNKGTEPTRSPAAPAEPAAIALLVLQGALGFSVRCTPRRQTLRVETSSGAVYVKVRDGRRADARAEWRWLRELSALGLSVPTPLALVERGRRSALATAAVVGRPCDAWFREAEDRDARPEAVLFACAQVAVAVARLHASGLVYRDLYWNHVFTDRLAREAAPVFLDVERVFRPRFRFERWRIKDLAGLRCSLPCAPGLRAEVRFLHAYSKALGLESADARTRRREWLVQAGQKARRIAAHEPKYGGTHPRGGLAARERSAWSP